MYLFLKNIKINYFYTVVILRVLAGCTTNIFKNTCRWEKMHQCFYNYKCWIINNKKHYETDETIRRFLKIITKENMDSRKDSLLKGDTQNKMYSKIILKYD